MFSRPDSEKLTEASRTLLSLLNEDEREYVGDHSSTQADRILLAVRQLARRERMSS